MRIRIFPICSFPWGGPFRWKATANCEQCSRIQPVQRLTAFQTEQIALNIIGDNRRLLRDLHVRGACDCCMRLMSARDSASTFSGSAATLPSSCGARRRRCRRSTILGLSPIFQEMCKTKNGLVLLTGATGSGKTTTLAAMLNEINDTQAVHIVTLEDPIEFVHDHKKATFSQRELGNDFDDFAERPPLRAAPGAEGHSRG